VKKLTQAPGRAEMAVMRLVTIMFFCILYAIPFYSDTNVSQSFIVKYYLTLAPPSVLFYIVIFHQKTIYFDQSNLTIITRSGEKVLPLHKIRAVRIWLLFPSWITYYRDGETETVVFIVNLVDFIRNRKNVTELKQNVNKTKME